MRPPEFLQVRH